MPHFTTSTRPRVLGFDTPWTGKPNKRPGRKFTVHLDLLHQLAKRCVSSGHIPEASITVRLRLATRRQIQKLRTIPTVYAHRICPLGTAPRSRARARGFSRQAQKNRASTDKPNASPDVTEDPGLRSYI